MDVVLKKNEKPTIDNSHESVAKDDAVPIRATCKCNLSDENGALSWKFLDQNSMTQTVG